jgi:hypothetical protein
MIKNRVTYLLALVTSIFLFAGCIPEDTLQWSQDGSVGLLRVEGALYQVDGQSGDLTEIAAENVQPWPDISKDGSMIAYSRDVECNNLSEGLKMLPAGQVEIIKTGADEIFANILNTDKPFEDEFPEPDEELLKPGDVKNWAIRYLCENADDKVSKVLGEDGIRKGKEKTIRYNQVVVVSRDNLNDKKVTATNIFVTFSTRLSPDNRYVSYIMQTRHAQEDDEYSLYIASLKDDIKSMLVDERVALGYDWRGDGRAIVYFHADSEIFDTDELVLGTLKERIVADEDNNLLAEPAEDAVVQTYNCTGSETSYAGLIFYPWQKVRYGMDGRIFFSTCFMSLPMSEKDEGRWSLFCYDTKLGAVSDVLPQNVSNMGQIIAMLQFELSPDGNKVLLPIKNNRFVIYEPSTGSTDIPMEEDEGFGDEEVSELIPMWKGNNEISFLVSGTNHFLPEPQDQNEPQRNEIIILNTADNQSRVLSRSWPDQIIEDIGNDN